MVFGCILKNFPEKIFWCLEKKKENTNSEKHKPQPRKKSSTTTLNTVRWPRLLREIAIEGEIALSIAIFARSRSTATGMFAGEIAIGADWRSRSRARALSLSLSLSHFPEILWRENRSVKWFPWSKAFFFRSTDFNFRKIEFSGPTKQPHFRKSISGSDFHPKQTQP